MFTAIRTLLVTAAINFIVRRLAAEAFADAITAIQNNGLTPEAQAEADAVFEAEYNRLNS